MGYTNALYAAAAKKSELLLVEADLKLFKETTKSSAALRNFVIDPSISRSKKVAGVVSLCAESGACDSTKSALSALAEGGLTAVITGAEPLEKAQLDEVMAALTKMTGGTGKVSVQTELDPSLIAGMTITFGDKYIDMSVASQVKRLNTLLMA